VHINEYFKFYYGIVGIRAVVVEKQLFEIGHENVHKKLCCGGTGVLKTAIIGAGNFKFRHHI
jgi:hypothetical protein